jgi:uncharacterized protein with HEPN domain
MRGNLGDRQRLLHILASIEEIENYIIGANFDSFLENSMMRFASVKQIEIIGEAANNITEEIKNKFTDIQWRQITGLRHVLVHEYFGVDARLIWQIIMDDIPDLKIKIKEILISMQDGF